MNQWCPQQGLTKPQFTKCESISNSGNTCENPQIKYGLVAGGIPSDHVDNDYKKWCEQLGGAYDSHTVGTRTGYCVFGATKYDDTVWHRADCRDGFWYNQTLDKNTTLTDFITSITCNKFDGK